MKLCSHRSPRRGEGWCYLKISDVAPSSDPKANRWSGYVFQKADEDGYRPYNNVKCTELLSKVCPYRIHIPRPKPEKKPPREKVMCPHCKELHTVGSAAIDWCKAYEYIKQNSNQPFDPNGTTKEFYPDWSLELGSVDVKARFWQSLALRILERDGYTCQDCGREFDHNTTQRWNEIEVHHIISRFHGGTDHPANLKAVCNKCHRKYTNDLMVDVGKARQIKNQVHKVKQLRLHRLDDF